MALSTGDTYTDVRRFTMPGINEEPDVQLRLYNDAQRQLLQAIRDDEASEVELREIVLDIPDIQKVVKRLEKERETYVHAANSIIIVAALIGTVTFTVFLTPPPGYLDAPALSVYVFYIYNSLAFFSAILTLVIGSSVTRPQFRLSHIAVIVPHLRNLLFIAYSLLYFSVAFFMSTFLIAGYIMSQFKVYNIVFNFIALVSIFIGLITGECLVTRNSRYFRYIFLVSSIIMSVPLMLSMIRY